MKQNYEAGRSTPALSSLSPTQGSINNEFNTTGFQIKSGMTGMEHGRSMVEMLGTLAIIGVLSIGAIAGYSYAMDKYRANDTIQDIHLRAVDILTQVHQGHFTPTLDEWKQEITHFPMRLVQDGDKFGVRVTGVPSRVCSMIGDGMTSDVEVFVDNEHTASVKTDDIDPCDLSENNNMNFFFKPLIMTTVCEPRCDADEYCDNGICMSGKNPEISRYFGDCTSDSDCEVCQSCQSYDDKYLCVPREANGVTCSTDSIINGQCYRGECIEKGCRSNAECDRGFYCASPNTSPDTDFPAGEYGACVDTDFSRIPIEVNGTEEVWYVSDAILSWWDARNICASINKDLIRIEWLTTDWDESASDEEKVRAGVDTTPYTLNERAQLILNRITVGWPVIWTGNETKDGKRSYYFSIADGHTSLDWGRNDAATGSKFAICR